MGQPLITQEQYSKLVCNPAILLTIEDLELKTREKEFGRTQAVRVTNALNALNIKTVLQLLSYSREELSKKRDFGLGSLGFLEDVLKPIGLHPGMEIPKNLVEHYHSDNKYNKKLKPELIAQDFKIPEDMRQLSYNEIVLFHKNKAPLSHTYDAPDNDQKTEAATLYVHIFDQAAADTLKKLPPETLQNKAKAAFLEVAHMCLKDEYMRSDEPPNLKNTFQPEANPEGCKLSIPVPVHPVTYAALTSLNNAGEIAAIHARQAVLELIPQD